MNVQIEKSGTPLEVEILELLEFINPAAFSQIKTFVGTHVEESIKRGYALEDLKAFIILDPVNERIIDKNMSFFRVKVVNPWANVSSEFKENPYFAFSFTKEKNQAIEKYKMKRAQLNKIILGAPSSTDGFSDIELNPKIVPEKDTFSPPVNQEYIKTVIDSINSLPAEKEIKEKVDSVFASHQKSAKESEEQRKHFDHNEYWKKEGEKEPLKDNTEKTYKEFLTGQCSPGEI